MQVRIYKDSDVYFNRSIGLKGSCSNRDGSLWRNFKALRNIKNFLKCNFNKKRNEVNSMRD